MRHGGQCRDGRIHGPSDPGIQLYVREKHLAGSQTFAGDRILLFVHGATYPAETSFDLPVGGQSMMDIMAARGWDVWMVDVRGYSRSTRPASMDGPPGQGTPIASTAATSCTTSTSRPSRPPFTVH